MHQYARLQSNDGVISETKNDNVLLCLNLLLDNHCDFKLGGLSPVEDYEVVCD